MRPYVSVFMWAVYDHLGQLVLLNLLWCLLALPWMAVASFLAVSAGSGGGRLTIVAVVVGLEFVLLSPPTAILFVAGREWARDRDVTWRGLFSESLDFAWRLQAIGLLLATSTLVLLLNLKFYQGLGGVGGMFLSGVTLWLLVAKGLVEVYLLPVLVTEDCGCLRVLRQSFLLAVDNFRATSCLLLGLMGVVLLGVLSGVGLLVGLGAAAALMINVQFAALLPKYTGHTLPPQPRRRLRDVLRPWEM